MFRRIIVAVSLTFLAGSAGAAGSMASDVRVIRVNPTPSIVRMGESARSEKTRIIRLKEQAKTDREVMKFEQKRALEADKAYYKRLEQDRKARSKKRKK